MTTRVQVVPGDMNQILPGSGYNMVFFSHVLYKKENLHNLLCRAGELLNPSGLFVTNHKFSDDWVFSPEPLIALENASIHRHHQMMPEEEYRIMLESVGVSAIQSWKIPATTGYTTLHVATKR